MTNADKWGFLGLNAFLSVAIFSAIIGFASCSKEITCHDCVVRCRPFDAKVCNITRPLGEYGVVCECEDKLERHK